MSSNADSATASDYLAALAEWAGRGFEGEPPQLIADMPDGDRAEVMAEVEHLKGVIAEKLKQA